jgi:hypothetical protein
VLHLTLQISLFSLISLKLTLVNVDALQFWMFPAHVNPERILSVFLNLAQRALVQEADINVHLLNMTPNVLFAQDLAARLADDPSGGSRHHIFVDERLH